MKYVPVEEFYFILFFKSSTVFVLFSLEVGCFISVFPSLRAPVSSNILHSFVMLLTIQLHIIFDDLPRTLNPQAIK